MLWCSPSQRISISDPHGGPRPHTGGTLFIPLFIYHLRIQYDHDATRFTLWFRRGRKRAQPECLLGSRTQQRPRMQCVSPHLNCSIPQRYSATSPQADNSGDDLYSTEIAVGWSNTSRVSRRHRRFQRMSRQRNSNSNHGRNSRRSKPQLQRQSRVDDIRAQDAFVASMI